MGYGKSSESSASIRNYYQENDYFGGRSYYDRSVKAKRVISNAQEIFQSKNMLDKLNPAMMKLPRESRDSALSPHSRAFAFFNDVTGSQSRYLMQQIQENFPELFEKSLNRFKFDIQIAFGAIGDVAAGDNAPLQVTQFEIDRKIIEQLKEIYLEECGGGNGSESYILAWYFCAKYCSIDCFEKRGEKGFCFTAGDEGVTPHLSSYELRRVFGNRSDLDRRTLSPYDCLEMASKKWLCYHIIMRQGSGFQNTYTRDWKDLLGGHACELTDYSYLPQLVLAILDMYSDGISKFEAIDRIESRSAREVVEHALADHEEYVEDDKSLAGSDSSIELF